jgi:hypothetical protein
VRSRVDADRPILFERVVFMAEVDRRGYLRAWILVLGVSPP